MRGDRKKKEEERRGERRKEGGWEEKALEALNWKQLLLVALTYPGVFTHTIVAL